MAVVVGNAAQDGDPYRGWFVGHFVAPEGGLRSTSAVEVKWYTHRNGDERVAWAASARATTLSMVISGAIRLYFAAGQERLLDRPGDYALWAPGVAHHWRIEQDDTVVLTIRWPSLAGDAADLDEAALAGA